MMACDAKPSANQNTALLGDLAYEQFPRMRCALGLCDSNPGCSLFQIHESL